MIRLESSEFDKLRLLSFVFVVRTYENVQVAENFTSQRILGEHSANSVLNQGKRLTLQLFLGSAGALTSGIARIADVFLLVPLVSSQNYFLCIDYDYKVTAISVRGEVRLMLAAQALSNFRC